MNYYAKFNGLRKEPTKKQVIQFFGLRADELKRVELLVKTDPWFKMNLASPLTNYQVCLSVEKRNRLQ